MLFMLFMFLMFLFASGSLMVFSLSFSLGLFVFVFLLIFFLISATVFFYSLFYMAVSVFFSYYIFLLFSFMFSMLFLVMSVPGLLFIIFWDLLGITSFMLVIFYSNWDSSGGGLNTLMCNHLGDYFLIIFFSSVLLKFNMGGWALVGCVVFMVVAAFTKSAQGPFMQWLPLAMSAPTPISSLVHSSTLVTGGIFLVFLFFWVMNNTSFIILMIWTFFVAGLLSLFEKDLKKLVAMSTLSQISFCMLIIFFSYFLLSLSHMFTHALFKSCLFMQVGSLIYYTWGSQESRNPVILNKLFQLLMIINIFSLCGLMFLSGMFSKDAVLLIVYGGLLNFFTFLLFFFSVSGTFFYSWILTKALFGGFVGIWLSQRSYAPIFLCGFAIIGGVLLQNFFLTGSGLYLESFILWVLLMFFFVLFIYAMKFTFFLYKLILNIFFKIFKALLMSLNILDGALNYGFLGANFFMSSTTLSFKRFFVSGFFVFMVIYLIFV